MHAPISERFSGLHSPVHRLPAGEKLVLAMALVVFVAALPHNWAWMLAPVAGLLFLAAWLSTISWRYLAMRLLAVEPLVLGVSALALFGPGGWRAFAILAVRCSLCVVTMLLLANTTPLSELLGALRRVRAPSLLLVTLALMYRYQFVLVDEAARMKRARASRTFTARRSMEWRSGASIISQLFIRSTERAERIYAAMCARGWR